MPFCAVGSIRSHGEEPMNRPSYIFVLNIRQKTCNRNGNRSDESQQEREQRRHLERLENDAAS